MSQGLQTGQTVRTAVWVLLLSGVVMAQTAPFPVPTTPPPRPRLVFTAADIPMLQARVQAGGAPVNLGWNQMAQRATFQSWGRLDPRTGWSLRGLTELATRYAIQGDLTAASDARAMLFGPGQTVLGVFRPGADDKPYWTGTHLGAVAIAYDLLHPYLTSSERAQVRTWLERGITDLQRVSFPTGPYSSYQSCTDNWIFGVEAGVTMALLAVWGERSSVHTPASTAQDIDRRLTMIHEGYLDVVSPDGSYDEGAGYANYGAIWGIRTLLAAENCGFGDRLSGTNMPRLPRWLGSMLMSDRYPWIGDASGYAGAIDDNHRGTRWDPVLYALVRRAADGVGFEALERLRALEPLGDRSDCVGYSPFLDVFLHYPTNLLPERDLVRSAFFRDNENIGPGGGTSSVKFSNQSGIGTGGHALLHNDDRPGDRAFSILSIIKDEWTNHGHEDDGHVSVHVDGVPLFLDLGYTAVVGTEFPQNLAHNIVSFEGRSFGSSNHYSPPYPNARFEGRRVADLYGVGGDYLRGDHRKMWQMDRAERSLLFLKDATLPRFVLLDVVDMGPGEPAGDYEQRWHTAEAMLGDGTVQDPFRVVVSNPGGPSTGLYGVLLGSRVPVSLHNSGRLHNPGSGLDYHQVRLRQTTSGLVHFFTVWAPAAPTAQFPLVAPAPETIGGGLSFPQGRTEWHWATTGAAGFADAQGRGDGRQGFVELAATGAVVAYSLCEGTTFDFGGQPLVRSAEPVSVVAHRGVIDVSLDLTRRGSMAPGATFAMIPGFLAVRVDGQTVPHRLINGQIVIGPAADPPYTDDRFYTFEPTAQVDGSLGGGAQLLPQGGLVTQPQTLGTFQAFDRSRYPAQPLYLAVDVGLEQPSSGSAQPGALLLKDPAGGELLRATFWTDPNTGGLLVYLAGSRFPVPLGVTLPAEPGHSAVRVGLNIDPLGGVLQVYDRFGALRGTAYFVRFVTPMEPWLEVQPGGLFKDFAVLDAVEDGVVPQGLAVWMHTDGRMGFHLGVPRATQIARWEVSIAGFTLDPLWINWFFGTAQFNETQVLPYLLPGALPPPTAREFTFRSIVDPGTVGPGFEHAFRVTTARAVQLDEAGALE